MCEKCRPGPDGIPVLEAGYWAQDKLSQLEYYANIFNNAMHRKWERRGYIDLFAGPGMDRVKGSPQETFDGSPIRMLKLRQQFTHYAFVDQDLEHIQALRRRSASLISQDQVLFRPGDCNDPRVVAEIRKFIPESALTLMFVDPFAFNIEFKTVAALTAKRRVDIIVNFQTVALRRATKVGTRKITDLFGDNGRWESIYESAPDRPKALLAHYGSRLSTLGYQADAAATVPIRDSRGIVQYYLFFASKDALGINFWKKTVKKGPSGQMDLGLLNSMDS